MDLNNPFILALTGGVSLEVFAEHYVMKFIPAKWAGIKPALMFFMHGFYGVGITAAKHGDWQMGLGMFLMTAFVAELKHQSPWGSDSTGIPVTPVVAVAKSIILAISFLLLFGQGVAVADGTAIAPAWDKLPLIPGIVTLDASNAEVGTFPDILSRRNFSYVGTNALIVFKHLDLKLGVSGFETEQRDIVGGIGTQLRTLQTAIEFLGGLVSVDSSILDNTSINLLGGYNTVSQAWMLGPAVLTRFSIPAP